MHFLNFAKKNKLGFLALEYSGHGKSSGKFIDGNISRWTNETTILIKKIVKKNKLIKKKNGIIHLKHGDYEYPITYQLIKDGRKNKVLHKKIYQKIYITMVHGNKDKSVPVSYSKKILNMFLNSKKKLVIVKNGDHSLSSPKWLKLLKTELKLIIN